MTVRETLLEIFENNRGVSFSGEELSERLGVSRNAVWKAIHQLKEDGFPLPKRAVIVSAMKTIFFLRH